MKKNQKNLALCLCLALAAVGVVAAVAAKSPYGLVNAGATSGAVCFDRTNGTYKKVSSSVYSTAMVSSQGTTMYFVTAGKTYCEPGSGYIASFGSGSSYTTQYFTIAMDEAGANFFPFQSITSVSMATGSSSSFSLPVYGSDDGSDWVSLGSMVHASGSASLTIASPKKYLKVTNPGTLSGWVDITSFTVRYSCDPEKSEESESSSSEESSSEEASIAGSYEYASSFGTTLDLVLNEDGTGTYTYSSYIASFSWTYAASKLTLTPDASYTADNFGNYRPFQSATTSNETGVVGDSGITLTVYNAFGSTKSYTFAKQ